MFNSPRYITRGIQSDIPVELQILMWGLIDQLKNKKRFEIDYLQVFDLKTDTGERNQLLIHRQEVPEYSMEYKFHVDNPVSAKIFVIDSQSDIEGESYTTMLLASEY